MAVLEDATEERIGGTGFFEVEDCFDVRRARCGFSTSFFSELWWVVEFVI